MPDIFISYTTEDRDRVKTLVSALADQGWSVWWDRDIPFGRPYDEVILQNLISAKRVIVVWSSRSTKRNYVLNEATYARDNDKLIPFLLEKVEIPLGFRRFQAAHLLDWHGQSNHDEFKKLLLLIGSDVHIAPQATVRQQPSHEADSVKITNSGGSETKTDLSSLILEILTKYVGNNALVGPNLSERKLANVKSKFKIAEDESILAVIDCSFFGTAKDAVVFTNLGVHCRNIAATPIYSYLPYSGLARLALSKLGHNGIEVLAENSSERSREITAAGCNIQRDMLLLVLQEIKKSP